jgi:type I restriction enzyme R subunit
VEDDREVRNLVFDMLQMDNSISTMQIQEEVIGQFGDEYPDMSLNDWRHIIEDYTSIVRIANQRKAKELYLDLKQAASPENEEE